MQRFSKFLFLACVILSLIESCAPARRLNSEQTFVKKNEIEFSKGSKKVFADELGNIIKQKPNRKIVGAYVYVGLHNLGNKKSERKRNKKLNTWLRDIGEAPVVLDSFLTETTNEQLKLYLKKHGYFDAKVSSRYEKTGFSKKKTKIYHTITPNTPYRINDRPKYFIEDTSFIKTFTPAARKTLIRSGEIYDEDLLAKERERMTKYFKNKGFYTFSKDFVFFEVDSTIGNHKVDVKLTLKNPYKKVETDSSVEFIETKHERYYLNELYIVTDYEDYLMHQSEMDTLRLNDYSILYHKELHYNPELLVKSTFLKQGDLYEAQKVDYTYGRLAALKTFKFITVRFEEISTANKKLLNATINLTPALRQSFGFETDVTNRVGNLGLTGNLVYRNKNSFKGAEVWEVRLKGGLEAVQLSEDVQEAQDEESTSSSALEQDRLFNTQEYGIESSLFIPELWIPKKYREYPAYEKPKTNFNLAFNYQDRPDFVRRLFNFSYQYSWNSNDFNNYNIHPVDISLIRINKESFFEERLETINNPFLTSSYSDHLITATKASYSYSDFEPAKLINYNYFKLNIESAGNLLRLAAPVIGLPETENTYQLGGIQFAQYVKLDADYRRYNYINKWSKMVYRAFGGIGVPLANLNVLPFEKSFFGGGSNDLRGWAVRSLGPGSLPDTVISIDQIGDISMLFNLEYRFDVVGALKGALFTDIGNIWLLNEDDQRPNGHFEFSRFFNEFAIASGIGARFDFSFFVLRVDAAVKMRDPKHMEGERWIFSDKPKTEAIIEEFEANNTEFTVPDPTPGFGSLLNINFGIGYPF